MGWPVVTFSATAFFAAAATMSAAVCTVTASIWTSTPPPRHINIPRQQPTLLQPHARWPQWIHGYELPLRIRAYSRALAVLQLLPGGRLVLSL